MPASQVSFTDLAYAAGIIDGEGHLKIYRTGHGSTSNAMVVGNTDLLMITWLHERFGGSVRRKRKHGYAREARDWVLTSKQAEDFLVAIRPYLIGKAQQADVMLAWRRLLRPRRGAHRLTAEQVHGREALQAQLRVMTRRTAYSADD